MGDTFNNIIIEPYLYSCNSIITKVNKEFIEFTGYALDELLGKSLIEISEMLKINSQIHLDNISDNFSGYIFTKLCEPKEVRILSFYNSKTNRRKYSFIEMVNSSLDDKLMFERQAFMDETSGVAVYSTPDLILLKANQRYTNLMNMDLNEERNIIGRPIGEIIKEFKGSQAEVSWNSILELKRTSYIKEFKNDDLSQSITYWDFVQTTILEKGKIKYIFESASEVTERVFKNKCLVGQNKIIDKQKEQLEQKNTQLTSILENLSEGVMISDDKGKIMMMNSEANRLIYKSGKENVLCDVISNGKLFDMMGNEISFEKYPFVIALRGQKSNKTKIMVKHTNEEYFVEISAIPIYNTSGDLTMVVSCLHDITETVKQSRKIDEQKEQLEIIINSFDLPVIRLSCPELKIVDINKKAFSFIQLLLPNIKSVEQIKTGNTGDLFKMFKTNEYFKIIREVLKEKRTKYLNKKSYIVNENEIYLNVIFEPVFDVEGEIEEILILLVDVTNEIKSNIVMEKELKSQGEFLVNISHELKTPLNVIFATAQLFNLYCNSGSLDEKRNSIIKYIDSIKQNSYKLSKLINNIVDISKIQAGFFKLNLSNNNIVEVVEEIVMSVTNFTESKGLHIIFDTNIEEKIIACDPEKIERIVLNLISNAIKFSEVGDEIFVDIKDKNEFVEISVKDNGIGIEDKHLNMIFDRFKQVEKSLERNSEGSGIGLNLVKSIVELHGGSIYVESEVGKGSKFTVKLPSIRVVNQNMIYNSKVRSANENILVELSDICL